MDKPEEETKKPGELTQEQKDNNELEDCRLELKDKEGQLVNREDIVEAGVKTLPVLERNRDLAFRENALECEEARIIMANPLKYKEGTAWSDHLIKMMKYHLDKLSHDKALLSIKLENPITVLVDQLKRCREDIPVLKKRIKVLKKDIANLTEKIK